MIKRIYIEYLGCNESFNWKICLCWLFEYFACWYIKRMWREIVCELDKYGDLNDLNDNVITLHRHSVYFWWIEQCCVINMLTRKHYVGVSFNDCLRIPIDDLKSSIGVDIYFLKLLLIMIS